MPWTAPEVTRTAVPRVAECVHREPGYASGRMGPEISVWRVQKVTP